MQRQVQSKFNLKSGQGSLALAEQQRAVNALPSKFNQAGMTLMELIAALAVAAVVIGGAVALYTSASSSERATAMVRDLMSIQTATRTLFSGQGTYGTTSLNSVLVKSKKLPTTITVGTGNALKYRNDNDITITGTGSGFTVAVSNVSPDLCVNLLTQSSGWTSVQVGTAPAITTFPISLAAADTACGTANATITFAGK